MLSALLLAFAAPQELHQSLHPADVDWFIEAPDVPSLLAAYDEAPMAKLFGDEEALGAMRRMLGIPGLSGDMVLNRGLEEFNLGLALEDLAKVQALSFSLHQGADGRGPGGLAVIEATSPEAATELASFLPDEFSGGWVSVEGDLIVLGMRSFTEADWAGLRESTTPNLFAVQAFSSEAVLLSPAEGPVVVRGLQQRNPLGTLQDFLGEDLEPLPQAWQFLLGDSTTHFRMAFERGRFVTETYSPAMKHPVAGSAWFAPSPFDPALLSEVHPGSLFVAAASFDKQGLRTQLGADGVDTPLFDKLGSSGVLFLQPIKGPSLPKGFLVVELNDATGVLDDIQALIESAGLGDGYKVKSRKYKGVPYLTLTLPQELSNVGDLGTLRPVVSVLDGKLFVTNGTLGLKAEIRRRAGDEKEQFGSFRYPWTGRPEYFGEGVHAAFYVDWAVQVDGIFSLARAFGGMLSSTDMPFDLTNLPSPLLFTQHMRPTTHIVSTPLGGVHHRHEASFSFETWLGLLGLGMTVGESMGLAPSERQAAAAPLQPAPAARATPLEITESRLRDLRTALSVYKIDQGRFPVELPALEQPTANYPKGFLESLTPDGWDSPFRYVPSADGSSYELWSLGPDGVDQNGAGDDVRAL